MLSVGQPSRRLICLEQFDFESFVAGLPPRLTALLGELKLSQLFDSFLTDKLDHAAKGYVRRQPRVAAAVDSAHGTRFQRSRCRARCTAERCVVLSVTIT